MTRNNKEESFSQIVQIADCKNQKQRHKCSSSGSLKQNEYESVQTCCIGASTWERVVDVDMSFLYEAVHRERSVGLRLHTNFWVLKCTSTFSRLAHTHTQIEN